MENNICCQCFIKKKKKKKKKKFLSLTELDKSLNNVIKNGSLPSNWKINLISKTMIYIPKKKIKSENRKIVRNKIFLELFLYPNMKFHKDRPNNKKKLFWG